MISKEDISILCNYTESKTQINPNSKIYFIDHTNEDDEEYLREVKSKNRGLAIDAVLEDKIEEYNNRDKPNWALGTDSVGVVGFKVHSMTLSTPSKFRSYDEIWNKLITHIELNTRNTHSYVSKTGMSTLTYSIDKTLSDEENISKFQRKFISRIMILSNMISIHLSRRGTGTFAIVGKNIPQYIDYGYFSNLPITNTNIIGNVNGINIIVSDKIQPNKVIIGRAETDQDGGGLMVVNDMNQYYMSETPRTFYKKFAWFEVI